MRVVLASRSPRRADLLRAAGVDFETVPVDVDESPRIGEPADTYVRRLATEKVRRAAAGAADAIVLGADTAVVIAGSILGKPEDDDAAVWMLTLLSGRTHQVMTAVAIRHGERELVEVATTDVHFRPVTPGEIRDYVATGEPRDKAGAYAIQGGAAKFIARIEGSHTNVVGLPMALVTEMLHEFGVAPRNPQKLEENSPEPG